MRTSTKTEIITELCLSVDKHSCSRQRWGQLSLALRKREDALVYDALVCFLEQQAGNNIEAQQFVGSLLLHLRPEPSGDLRPILNQVLVGWNRSVEEVPWYLALAFGEDAFLRALDEVHDETDDEEIRAKTRTCRWWLQARRPRTEIHAKAEHL